MSSERPARVRTSTFGDDEALSSELPLSWPLQKFQAEVTNAVKEYLLNVTIDQDGCLISIVENTVLRLRDLLTECPGFADELGVVAIRVSVDRHDISQLAVVDLMRCLYSSSALDSTALVRAFEKLFCSWEDIALDAPRSPVALLAVLFGCIGSDLVHRDLLTKVPEGLMNAGRADLPLGETVQDLRSISTSSTSAGERTPGSTTGRSFEQKLPDDASQMNIMAFNQCQSDDNGRVMFADNAAELKEFKSQMSSALEDYFTNPDLEAVERRLQDHGQNQYHHEFVKKAIVTSFSQRCQSRARESVLALFQHLTIAGVLSKDDLQWGITRLLSQLTDLELDCPQAADLTSEILFCMVVDELVSIPFLCRCQSVRIGGVAGLQIIDAARTRTPEYRKTDLETRQFKREVNIMILEYFNSCDTAEFGRCVRDLAPLSKERGAELVRKIMHLAMERSGNECELVLNLLVSLCRDEEISERVLEFGFDDLYRVMPDVILDVPDAPLMAKAFVVEAKKGGILSDSWAVPEW